MAFIAYTYILLTTYCHHQYKYFCNLILLMPHKPSVSYANCLSQVLSLILEIKFSREFEHYLTI